MHREARDFRWPVSEHCDGVQGLGSVTIKINLTLIKFSPGHDLLARSILLLTVQVATCNFSEDRTMGTKPSSCGYLATK